MENKSENKDPKTLNGSYLKAYFIHAWFFCTLCIFGMAIIGYFTYEADIITYDLHADAELVKDNVMTEYEEKFSSMGNPICKYVISRE